MKNKKNKKYQKIFKKWRKSIYYRKHPANEEEIAQIWDSGVPEKILESCDTHFAWYLIYQAHTQGCSWAQSRTAYLLQTKMCWLTIPFPFFIHCVKNKITTQKQILDEYIKVLIPEWYTGLGARIHEYHKRHKHDSIQKLCVGVLAEEVLRREFYNHEYIQQFSAVVRKLLK